MADTIDDEAAFSARGDSWFARAVANPWQSLLWMVVVGFCLGAASIILHVHSVNFDGYLVGDAYPGGLVEVPGAPHGGKEVGYLMAPNWGLFGVLVTPLLVFWGLQMIGAMDRVLEQAANNGMLRDEAFNEIPAAEVQAAWARHRKRNRVIFAVMFVLVLGYAFSDWWDVVAQPMLYPDVPPTPFSDQTMEYDWSVAAMFQHAPVGVWPLVIFTFVAYLFLAGFAPAFAFAVVISALHFVGFIASLGSRRRWRLAAMPGDDPKDTHCGFDCFAGFFNNLLLSMLCILVGLELMVLQNAYLRTDHASFVDFILSGASDLRKMPAPDWAGWFIEPLMIKAANPQAGLTYLLFPFVCIVAVGVTWVMLRSTAIKAREFSEQHLAAVAAKTGRSKKSITAALEHMKFWPVGWIGLNMLLTVMVVMFRALTSYRLLFPVFAIIVGLAVPKMWSIIQSGGLEPVRKWLFKR
jgi:hypothetical protein